MSLPLPGYKAKWIAEDLVVADEVIAKTDDILEIHGQHESDGEYVARGTRTSIYFWVKPNQIKFLTIEEEKNL